MPDAKPAWSLRAFTVGWSRDWQLKTLGCTLATTLFFAAYFLVLHAGIFPVRVLPLTALDRAVGFQPNALWIYLTLWIYIYLVPGLLGSRRDLLRYTIAVTALAAIGLAIFLLWPTAIPAHAAEWGRYPAFRLLAELDASGNACPSLHVAFAIFTAIGLSRLLGASAPRRWHCLNWVWSLAIVYSTLAIKQHVALDALCGAILGALVAAVYWRWSPPAPRKEC